MNQNNFMVIDAITLKPRPHISKSLWIVLTKRSFSQLGLDLWEQRGVCGMNQSTHISSNLQWSLGTLLMCPIQLQEDIKSCKVVIFSMPRKDLSWWDHWKLDQVLSCVVCTQCVMLCTCIIYVHILVHVILLYILLYMFIQ